MVPVVTSGLIDLRFGSTPLYDRLDTEDTNMNILTGLKHPHKMVATSILGSLKLDCVDRPGRQSVRDATARKAPDGAACPTQVPLTHRWSRKEAPVSEVSSECTWASQPFLHVH